MVLFIFHYCLNCCHTSGATLLIIHVIVFILGTHFGVDLMHRKAEVKDIITEVINNMSDEEEGEEADDNAEAGGDADKDGDGDDDA